MNIAIITGASSGLGREYIRELNRKEKDLDEIWAIARRKNRLEELSATSAIRIRPIPLDLTDKDSISHMQQLLEEEKPSVRLLINAAGFGRIGRSEDIGIEESNRMLDLNCRAAMDMTLACLPYMEPGSRIMEICSTAGFQPFQHLNVYAASKAFLFRFTRALRIELLPRRIKVTAVCPYWIKDTEFIGIAKDTPDHGKGIRHFPFASSVRSVARISLAVNRCGLPVATPGIVCTVHRIAAKFIPSELMMGIWEILRRF